MAGAKVLRHSQTRVIQILGPHVREAALRAARAAVQLYAAVLAEPEMLADELFLLLWLTLSASGRDSGRAHAAALKATRRRWSQRVARQDLSPRNPGQAAGLVFGIGTPNQWNRVRRPARL